jgi:hypothetical protein
VCARCTGIYAGAALAALAAAAWKKDRPVQRRSVIPRIPNPESRITAVSLAALPTALTLAYEWTTGVTPANGIRAAAGIVLGAVIAWLVVYDVD